MTSNSIGASEVCQAVLDPIALLLTDCRDQKAYGKVYSSSCRIELFLGKADTFDRIGAKLEIAAE